MKSRFSLTFCSLWNAGSPVSECVRLLRDNFKVTPNQMHRVGSTKWMPKLLAALLFAVILRAQTPAPEIKDPLGRSTPQQSIFNFLEACHARDYSKATYYLDLGRMSAADRAKAGPDLAMQLEDLLDDSTFDIVTLSRDPEGDLSDLSPNIDKLASFEVNGQQIVLQLEREEPRSGNRIWLVSAASVALIPKAHQAVAETPFEKKLPQVLV